MLERRKKGARAFGRDYFERYCGHGSYDEDYLFHSGIEHCIATLDRWGVEIASVAVLGAATGRVLEHFEDAWGVRPYGCEISTWAHARIRGRYRRRIARADLRAYTADALARGRRFDLVFSNALVYLEPDEVGPVLARCAKLAPWFHFWSSTAEDFEPGDRLRVTLRPRAWWRRAFVGAGYSPTRSPYLWRVRSSPPAARRRAPRGEGAGRRPS